MMYGRKNIKSSTCIY